MRFGISSEIKNSTTTWVTQSNTSAEPVSKVMQRKTCPKHSITSKMSCHSEEAIDFRQAYGIQNSLANRTMQRDLIAEEFKEFVSAFQSEPYENQLKELADLVYVCYQFAENMEWDLDEALRRVHRSNMSKLGLDGKPIRRSDGKVLKGPNYQAPTLNDLIQ